MDLKLAVERLEDCFKREAESAHAHEPRDETDRRVQGQINVASQLAHRAVELSLLAREPSEIGEVRRAAAALLEAERDDWSNLCANLLEEEGVYAEDSDVDVVSDVLSIAEHMLNHLRIEGEETEPEKPKPKESFIVPSHRDTPPSMEGGWWLAP